MSSTGRTVHHQPDWMTKRSQEKPGPFNQRASRGVEPHEVIESGVASGLEFLFVWEGRA
jgi:hypothetical protein